MLVMDALTFMECCFALLVCTLLLPTSLWLVYQWRYRKLLAFADSLPVVSPRRRLVGNLGVFLANNKQIFSMENITKILVGELKTAAGKRFGIFCFWIGPKPIVIVQNPSDVQAILNNSKAIDKGLDLTKIAFGDGLIVASGPKWKKARKLIGPIFNPSSLKKLVPIWNDSSTYLVDKLGAHVNCGPVDVFPHVMATSVRSICAIIFGGETVAEIDEKTIYSGIDCMQKGVDIIATRCLFPTVWMDAPFRIIYRKELASFETLWNGLVSHYLEILSLKQSAVHDKHGLKKHTEKGEDSSPTNLIDALSHVTSEKELRDEIKTLFGTGTETVAVALCSCLLILAKHQDIQEALYTEIVSVTGRRPQGVEVSDLDHLPFLHRVVKEALRTALVVPLVPRKLDEDIRLRDCILPKGETVVISIVGLHYDPQIYPNPGEFNPDHHITEKVQKRHPYSFLPFGGGPRNCIGKNFAFMSLKISLIHLLKAFKITSKVTMEDLRYTYRSTLASMDGYELEVQRRI